MLLKMSKNLLYFSSTQVIPSCHCMLSILQCVYLLETKVSGRTKNTKRKAKKLNAAFTRQGSR
jgi:hypothetical protein